jgi:hypothetical protein
VTGVRHLQCGGETKVTLERIGTKVTSAGGRLGPSTSIVAVTLSFKATCWTAGSISFSVGPGPHDSNRLRVAPKKLLWGWGDEESVQKRAVAAWRHMVGLFWLCLVANPLALREVAHRVTGVRHLQCGGETKVTLERIGTKVTSAGD